MVQILNGKEIADQIKSEVKSFIIKQGGSPPCLAVVLCSNDPASEIYVQKKRDACEECGIVSYLLKPFESGIEKWSNPKKHLFSTIDYLNNDPSVHGILVQLPLPEELNAHEVFDYINPVKDVDVFSPTNVGLLLQGRPRFVPCTPQAVQELLTRSDIAIAGKKVTIVNRSDIVGKPLSALLVQNDWQANATVTVCHDHTPPEMLKSVCLASDIIVVAVGQKDFLTSDMVPQGAVVIDVGINRLPNSRKIVGDVHPDVYKKVSAYTPVPGGVGPCTVACLLRNTLKSQQLLVQSQFLT